MKKYIILIFSICLTQFCISQNKSHYNLKWGVNADYSISGSTNTLVVGPALFWGKKKESESEFWHAINVDAGLCWSKDIKTSPVTSAGYYLGSIPGFMFGVSSQQYYNMETKFDNLKTDFRLSGEVVFAFFGFIGYRYQHPLISKNEAVDLTRHAFFIRIPIPLKTFSKQ